MNSKQGIILLVSEKSKETEHCVELVARVGKFMLKLLIEEENVKDLLREFRVQTPMEVAGREIIIDLETGFLSRKRGVKFKTEDSIYVTSKISFPQ